MLTGALIFTAYIMIMVIHFRYPSKLCTASISPSPQTFMSVECPMPIQSAALHGHSGTQH